MFLWYLLGFSERLNFYPYGCHEMHFREGAQQKIIFHDFVLNCGWGGLSGTLHHSEHIFHEILKKKQIFFQKSMVMEFAV